MGCLHIKLSVRENLPRNLSKNQGRETARNFEKTL